LRVEIVANHLVQAMPHRERALQRRPAQIEKAHCKRRSSFASSGSPNTWPSWAQNRLRTAASATIQNDDLLGEHLDGASRELLLCFFSEPIMRSRTLPLMESTHSLRASPASLRFPGGPIRRRFA